MSRCFSSPLCSDEDATGGLRPEIRRAGGEEDEQLLHHGADVGGRHQRQGEIQRAAVETGQGGGEVSRPAFTDTVINSTQQEIIQNVFYPM